MFFGFRRQLDALNVVREYVRALEEGHGVRARNLREANPTLGPAFDLAGCGIAPEDSLIALELGVDDTTYEEV